jgi:hypothetical protein
MREKLEKYVKGDIHYTRIMNIIMNNRSKDWYSELGKYINETLDIEKIPHLSYFVEQLKKPKGIITNLKYFSSDERIYSSIAIDFLTSVLDDKALENMFGEPILHSEFGEGFDGEWNEELDDYDDPEIKEYYASYFVNVGGTNFHIGYDHRGTSIEIEGKYKLRLDPTKNLPSNEEAKSCFESLKKIVDLYKSKN